MKKVLLIAALALFGFSVNAQDGSQTDEGKWLIETNTNFGAAAVSNTGISFTSFSDDAGSLLNIGGEVGYFVAKDLAVKVGLGFGSIKANSDADAISTISYKIGAKYYISSMIPVQVDYSGASTKDIDENPSYVGLQAGYAVFLGENVSIEPGLRYNVSLNDDFYTSALQFNIGFALHF